MDKLRGSLNRSRYIEKLVEEHSGEITAALECEVKQEPIIIKPDNEVVA